jgi:uncharacterized protein YndB with AHSA1/START domain
MTTHGSSSKLTVSLPSEREIVLTRVFHAPRALVWEAVTRPEHLVHWWGRTGSTLPVCEVDFRPGGAYRYVERAADGSEHGFRGTYREIVPPERVVNTFEYEGLPGHVSVDTMTLQEQPDGTTLLTSHALFDSVEDRDGMVQSGMEYGAEESYSRLDAYLASLA